MNSKSESISMWLRHNDCIFGFVFFISFIAAYFILGISAAVKVLGIACLACGMIWIVKRSIPIGIEGRPPSFFLRGLPAVFAGIAMLLMGIVLLKYPVHAACLLGWANEKVCFY